MSHSGKLRNMTSLYLLRDDKILLLYRQGNSIVKDMWVGSAGGHFEDFELNDPKACVLRELQEELGLSENALRNLRFRYATKRNMDNEIRQNYYFFAELNEDVPWELPSSEGLTQWFTFHETQALKMPFTAKYVVDHYIRIGQFNAKLYGGIGNDDGVTFIEL